MAIFIGVERIKKAVSALFDWRGRVKQQGTSHILPLLALLEKGVNETTPVRFEEDDDYSFFNRYNRIGTDAAKPYFDPFTRQFRIALHPHSNSATARKGTFARSWRAATFDSSGGPTTWTLATGFADIVRDRVLTKGKESSRVSVVDLAVWLFREEEFPDASTAEMLRDRFRDRFKMSDATFDTLFVFEPEPAASIFVDTKPAAEDIAEAVKSLAISEAAEAIRSAPVTGAAALEASKLEPDDTILLEVEALIQLGTSGIILRGAPGTGKSWYAYQVALALTGGESARVFRVQFHPSFTYEDFFDGYVPDEDSKSGFKIEARVFRKAIHLAASKPDQIVVLVIDEINRGDTARIFGESLTYIESGWRDVPFTPRLDNKEVKVPRNLFVLATMNPHDRSITQLDMALLRRFDHVDIPPSREQAGKFLLEAGMSPVKADAVSGWFSDLQSLLPFGLGHTYFLNVSDEAKLGLVWRYRIRPFCESILEFDQDRLAGVLGSYEALQGRLRGLP